jgi:PIN domain nuclease of toxin-antitoxin system
MPSVAEQMLIEVIQPTAQETASFHRLPKLQYKDPIDRMII